MIDDQAMQERPKKKKRGPYTKTTDQAFAASVSNVIRRGYRTEQAADAGNIRSSTLRSALKRYRLRGTAKPLKRGRKPRGAFNDELVYFLFGYVDQHPFATVEDVLDEVAADPVVHEFKPSKTTLHNWLRENARLTFQWMQSFPPEPSADEGKRAIEEYSHISDMPTFNVHENCVFIREAA